MDAVEAVRLAEEIGRRLRRTADARQFRDAVRRQGQLETRLDDRGADRIMAAAGAQGRDRAFIVAMRIAERVGRQLGVMEPGLDDVGHQGSALRSGARVTTASISAIDLTMNRAVIGVPSKWRIGTSRAGSISASVVNKVRICASRFCSTTKTRSWLVMKSSTSSWNGKARRRSVSRWMPSPSSDWRASSIASELEPK